MDLWLLAVALIALASAPVTSRSPNSVPANLYNNTACNLALQASGLSPPMGAELAEMLQWFRTHSLLMVGDSTTRQVYNWLHKENHVPDSCVAGPGVCDPTLGDNLHATRWCLNPRMKRTRAMLSGEWIDVKGAGRSDWDVVLWNLGSLHLLGLHPVRITRDYYSERPATSTGAINLTNRPAVNYTFDDFYHRALNCAEKLNEAYPASLRVARLTNRICSDRFRGMYETVATERLAATEDPTGYLMQMNEVGAAALNVAEREAARVHGHLIKDSDTYGMCECTKLGDGRHFLPTIPGFLWRLFLLLNASVPSARQLGEPLRRLLRARPPPARSFRRDLRGSGHREGPQK